MSNEIVFIVAAVILAIIFMAVMFVPQRKEDDPQPKYRVVAEPGHLPTRAHESDAGMDLRAKANYHIPPGGRVLVATGVKGDVPAGYVGMMCPRSGLANRHGITILNAPGIVDSGYTGEVKANLINLGDKAHVIRKGERVAQLLIVPDPHARIVEVDMLAATERGDNGHGSTGSA